MFNLFGVTVHLYGIILGVGVWVGLEIAVRVRPKDKKEIEEGFFWALGFGLLGARLYHMVDYWQRYYQYNFWKIFAVWEGGLGIWGAIVGAVIGLLIYSRIKKIKLLPLLDAFAVGAPMAQAIGRLGNWANGELTGKNDEPLFAYEAFLNVLLFSILWKISKNKIRPGKLFGVYLIGYGIIRILLEKMRPNEIIWMIGEIPTAIIFGVGSMVAGFFLIRKKQS